MFSASETKPFLHTLFAFFGSEFPNFDNINIHGVGIPSFGGRWRRIGRIGGQVWSFIWRFHRHIPIGFERNGLLIPIVDGGRDSVHRHDSAHEGRGDACREVSEKDILIGDACEGGVGLGMRDILDEGQRVGVVLSLGHALSGEPGDGIASGFVVFERGFKLCNEVG